MVLALSSVGVPEMVPSVVLKVKPAGNDGEIDQEVITPVMDGVTEVMAVPLVKVNESGS